MAVMVLSVMSVSAQKGTWYLGTSGINLISGDGAIHKITGFSVYDPEGGEKLTTFGLAPEVGFFVSDNIALGLGAFYSHAKSGDAKMNTFGVNPYARYYFYTNGNFKAYGQFDVLYASQKPKGGSSIAAFSIGARPGISYNLSNNVAINATYGFLGYEDVEDSVSSFGLSLDASALQFGFTIAF